jgi:hypothetical protein
LLFHFYFKNKTIRRSGYARQLDPAGIARPTKMHVDPESELWPAPIANIHREKAVSKKYHVIIQNPKYPRRLKLLLGALACILDVRAIG